MELKGIIYRVQLTANEGCSLYFRIFKYKVPRLSASHYPRYLTRNPKLKASIDLKKIASHLGKSPQIDLVFYLIVWINAISHF